MSAVVGRTWAMALRFSLKRQRPHPGAAEAMDGSSFLPDEECPRHEMTLLGAA